MAFDDFEIVANGLPSGKFPPARNYRWAIIQLTDFGYLVYPSDDLPIGEVKDGRLISRYMPECFCTAKQAKDFIDNMVV